jgi:hypothetical protein
MNSSQWPVVGVQSFAGSGEVTSEDYSRLQLNVGAKRVSTLHREYTYCPCPNRLQGDDDHFAVAKSGQVQDLPLR